MPATEPQGIAKAASNTIPLMSTTQVHQSDIEAGLHTVGLGHGDLVFVHSSLSAFGHVVGGADTVIDALLAVVGSEGTAVVPTFTWDRFHDERGAVFNIANTPSEVGAITETFRLRPDARRSSHICHSVAAIGPKAEAVMGDGVRPFGKGSTFEQLVRLDSWYLFLGVGFEVCTALHHVEEMQQVPYRYYRDFRKSVVVFPDGRRRPSRAVEYLRRDGYRNDLARAGPVLADAGVLRTTEVGDATVTNIRMRDIIEIIGRRVETDPYFLVTR